MAKERSSKSLQEPPLKKVALKSCTLVNSSGMVMLSGVYTSELWSNWKYKSQFCTVVWHNNSQLAHPCVTLFCCFFWCLFFFFKQKMPEKSTSIAMRFVAILRITVQIYAIDLLLIITIDQKKTLRPNQTSYSSHIQTYVYRQSL